ncbi:MAG: phosphatase PAP2 family protein [Pseudomonadota bacterium]
MTEPTGPGAAKGSTEDTASSASEATASNALAKTVAGDAYTAPMAERARVFARAYWTVLWTKAGGRLFRTWPKPDRSTHLSQRPAWRTPVNLTALALSLLIFLVVFVDEAAFAWADARDNEIKQLFLIFSEAGKADWMLVGAGGIYLAAIAVITVSPSLRVRAGYVDVAARAGFVFLAVALPGIAVALIKQIVGRARPLVEGEGYLSFSSWQGYYFASFPSGDATNGAAFAVAMGFLFPRFRLALWLFAAWVAFGRVLTERHFPSDVTGGILIATVCVLLLRSWFARRRLVFAERSDAIALLHRPHLGGAIRSHLGTAPSDIWTMLNDRVKGRRTDKAQDTH